MNNRKLTSTAAAPGCLAGNGNARSSGSDRAYPIPAADGHRQLAEQVAAALGRTTAAAEASPISNREPEFVRVSDLRGLTGIKRGLAYRKIADGTFKSISLREPGSKFGVRLVYWASVKAWLLQKLQEQNKP